MATNPMKRREHNAMLIGLLLGLVITAIVGFVLYYLYNEQKKVVDGYIASEKMVVVAANDISTGNAVTEEDFVLQKVIVDGLDTEKCFKSIDDIFYTGENNDGELLKTEVSARLDIPKGTIITSNLIQDDNENKIQDDTRLVEYSSFVLPSELKEGDFVDVRLALPTGQDFIVLSKKSVIKTNENTVWLNMNEAEILTLSCAMVEAWTITGTKLYAIEYADAGMQKSAILTYQPSAEVTSLIASNPNIADSAAEALANQWQKSDARSFRDKYINGVLQEYVEDRDEAVETGFAEEITNIKAHRSEYIQSLGE